MFGLRLVVTMVKPVSCNLQIRCLSKLSTKHIENNDGKMQAWQIHSYGGLTDLKLSNVRIPIIKKPNDVLIKIRATSVNPIDLAISQGYGATLLNMMRKTKAMKDGSDVSIEFPLTMGRDFSGIVASKGHNIGDRLTLGEKVWGVVPIDQQGCHAEYVVVDGDLVNPQPGNLSDVGASSILYAGLTAWSALWITGNLWYETKVPSYKNKRILVLGGSGGVGTLAIQLLKAWNIQVVTTCSTDAVELVESLGAHIVVDYNDQYADSQIIEEGPYDIILDCCNLGINAVKAKGYSYNTFITLNSPLLKNVDELGIIKGFSKNLCEVIRYNVPILENNTTMKWGFFLPSQMGINVIQNFVKKGKILPVVQKVYQFNELPEAYERVTKGHLRGKIVIEVK